MSDNLQKISILPGLFTLSYPSFLDFNPTVKFPFSFLSDKPLQFKLPLTSLSLRLLFLLGLFFALPCLTLSLTRRLLSSLRLHLKSFLNAKKYLDASGGGAAREKMYVAIYGAGNKAGKAYAKFMIEKGFNIIIIDSAIIANKHGVN